MQFNVRDKFVLDIESYSPAVSLMCGLSGLQSPLEKVQSSYFHAPISPELRFPCPHVP